LALKNERSPRLAKNAAVQPLELCAESKTKKPNSIRA
jgi:hypothetical protein